MATLKDADMANLPATKQGLLRMAASYADEVKKEPRPNGRSEWRFYFDEGAFKAQACVCIRQDRLSARSIITMLEEVSWPGFVSIVERAEFAVLSVLRAEENSRNAAKATAPEGAI